MKRIQHIQDTYKTTLTSRKPLQHFPDDYNGSISLIGVVDEIKGRDSTMEYRIL